MKTVSSNPKSQSSDWDNCPQFYLNGLDRSQLGILTIPPKPESFEGDWFGRVEKALRTKLELVEVVSTSTGKTLFMIQGLCVGVVNGKDVSAKAIAEYIAANQLKITSTVRESVDPETVLAALGV